MTAATLRRSVGRLLSVGLTGGLATALAACGTGSVPLSGPVSGPASSRSTPAGGPSASRPSPSRASTGVPSRLVVRLLRARLPVALAREAVVTQGAYAVVAGGMIAGDSSTAASYRLDLHSLRVTPLPSLPVPVHDTAGSVAGGIPLVIGGGNAAEQSVVQAWDGTAWHVIGNLPDARSDLVAAVVGGRVIVLGGYNGTRPAEPGILASREGRRWRRIGTLPEPVRYAASAVADGSIWLFGGERAGAMQTAIQRIDPRTGAATVVAHLPTPTGHAAAMTIGARILVAGGRTGASTATDRMWWFDPSSGAVTPAGRLPVPLTDSAVAAHDGHFLLIGGEDPGVTDRIVEVRPTP